MKTKEINMRSLLRELFNASNKDAIEGVVACVVCLVLTSAIGIANSPGTIGYLVFRSYFAVLISSMGIRYVFKYANFDMESIIMVLLLGIYISESAYVIIDEFVLMFCR